MKRFWIVAAALVALGASIGGLLWHARQRAALEAEEQATRQQVQNLIDGLKVPPEAIFRDRQADARISQVRRDAYLAHGQREYIPYANQVAPRSIRTSDAEGRVIDRVWIGFFDGQESESWWRSRATSACTNLKYACRESTDIGQYLRRHPEIYEAEIRWRLLAIAESWQPSLAIAACQTLAAFGEDSDELRQRLEDIHFRFGQYRKAAADLLAACGFPVPPEPNRIDSLPALPGPTSQPDGVEPSLPPGALARLGEARLRQGGPITCTAFSPNGKLLASGGRDKWVRVWDTSTGLQKHAVLVGKGWTHDLALASDSLLVTAAGCVQVWDLDSGEELARVDAVDRQSFTTIAVSPDGQRLAIGDNRLRGVWVYELPSLQPVGGNKNGLNAGQHGQIFDLGFSPDGRRVLAADSDNRIVLIDAINAKIVASRKLTKLGHQSRVTFLPDGNGLCVSPDTMVVWDLSDYSVQSITTPDGIRPAMAAAGGGTLLVRSKDSLIPWDATTLRPRGETLPRLEAVSISSDGKLLAGASGSAIRILELPDGRQRFSSDQPTGAVQLLGVSGRGDVFALADGKVYRWRKATGQVDSDLAPPEQKVLAAAYDATRDMLAWTARPAGDWKAASRLRIVPVPSSEPLLDLEVPGQGDGYLFFGRTMYDRDRRLLLAARDGTLSVWNIPKKQLLYRFHVGRASVSCLAILNRQPLCIVTAGEQVEMWSEEHHMRGAELNGVLEAQSVAASPDGERFLSLGERQAAIWNFHSKAMGQSGRYWASVARVIDTPQLANAIGYTIFNSIAWLADEDLLFVNEGYANPDIVIIDLRTGRALGRLPGHRGEVNSMRIVRRRLYTSSLDSSILIWDLDSITRWCKQLRRSLPDSPAVAAGARNRRPSEGDSGGMK